MTQPLSEEQYRRALRLFKAVQEEFDKEDSAVVVLLVKEWIQGLGV